MATITKENTTEALHADILTAIVDAMPEDAIVPYNAIDVIGKELSIEEYNEILNQSILKYNNKLYLNIGTYTDSILSTIKQETDLDSVYQLWGTMNLYNGEIDGADLLVLGERAPSSYLVYFEY